MSHLPFTLFAYFLNSVAVLVDKFLLTKHNLDPLIYIFYISLFSLLALLFLPFVEMPGIEIIALSSLSTILWTLGAYMMYKALQFGRASRVIPIIGTLIPILLLAEAIVAHTVNDSQIVAVILLVFGLIFLTFPDWQGKITKKELNFEILSSVLFAVSYLVLREAYLQENFLSVLVWSRMILIPLGTLLLIIPHTRHIVLTRKGPKINFTSKTGMLFLVGQAAGGTSELLLTFSIYLATPALVNSIQGSQYAFLFLFSLILARRLPSVFEESFSGLVLIQKFLGLALIGFGLYFLAFNSTV